ncbi:ribbon-helix-helix domain-containing protein [uncultured Actinomyces sp.]|nr:ribbon-helix-helix domain-containing protein [uncultured Actinomyces sp.]
MRLPESTNDALDAYVREHNTTASAVIRDAVEAYLATTGPVG